MMENEKMSKVLYEQPIIKKHGTMKELTLQAVGSGGDLAQGASDPNTVFNDTATGDTFLNLGANPDDQPYTVNSIRDRTGGIGNNE